MTSHPIPVVLCERVRSSSGVPQWKFWCRFCSAYHHHGGYLGKNGDIGHRAPASPFQPTGYILKPKAVSQGGPHEG